jgi:hypothetical protein
MSSRIVNAAHAVDDFLIDRVLQPAANAADWHFELSIHTLARVCLVIGAGVGVIWLHRFDAFPGVDFYQDVLCLVIMVTATFMQVKTHEKLAPRRAGLAPAVRVTGFWWRMAWLLDLALFPFQWPVEGHSELVFNFVWTFLVVLPYWIICCRRTPPPVVRRVGALIPATISSAR